MFACHQGAPGHPGTNVACAGWLAVEGTGHVAVRLAVSHGRLPVSALSPGPNWPDLYDSYQEMADANAAHEEGPRQ
ncbi:hypothetical protein DQ384_39205 [Sphaerisporangium album]|uniref:Uncharacterized protein n=1 Tax=Sphaerisporangium album TaxID=509200 RepID=A0A367ELZ9_9ACTN|nr:hypothetical protein DQ384_39205 [Sphaerisporangium album]